MFSSIPPGTWRLAGLLLLGLFCGWIGYTIASRYYEPLLAQANAEIAQLKASNSALQTTVEHQNAAVIALQTETDRRYQAAQAKVKQVQRSYQQIQTQAQALLLQKPTAGLEECQAAQQAFDAALREERVAP